MQGFWSRPRPASLAAAICPQMELQGHSLIALAEAAPTLEPAIWR